MARRHPFLGDYDPTSGDPPAAGVPEPSWLEKVNYGHDADKDRLPTIDEALTFLQQVGSAGTFTLGDEAYGAVHGLGSLLKGGSWSEGYDPALAFARKSEQNAAERNPKSALGGNITGTLVTNFLVPASFLASGLKGINSLRKALMLTAEAGAIGGATTGAAAFGASEGGFGPRLKAFMDEAHDIGLPFGLVTGGTLSMGNWLKELFKRGEGRAPHGGAHDGLSARDARAVEEVLSLIPKHGAEMPSLKIDDPLAGLDIGNLNLVYEDGKLIPAGAAGGPRPRVLSQRPATEEELARPSGEERGLATNPYGPGGLGDQAELAPRDYGRAGDYTTDEITAALGLHPDELGRDLPAGGHTPSGALGQLTGGDFPAISPEYGITNPRETLDLMRNVFGKPEHAGADVIHHTPRTGGAGNATLGGGMFSRPDTPEGAAKFREMLADMGYPEGM